LQRVIQKLTRAPATGPGNRDDLPAALALDASGNVYVTGSSGGGASGTFPDYAPVKYDAGGSELWVRRYNGPGNRNDSGVFQMS
jgi:hypothetical protein